MPAALSWTNHLHNTALAISASVASSLNMTAVAFDSAYPATNAYDSDPSKVARVTYTRNAVAGGYVFAYWSFATTLATQKAARILGLLNCRIPAAATLVTIKAYDYLGAGVFEQSYAPADLVPKPGTTDRFDLYALHSADANVASLGLLVHVPVSTTDYVEIGEGWIGPALVLPDGVDKDWSILPVDPSEVERLRLGALVANRLPTRRKLAAPITRQVYNTAMGTPGSAAALNFRALFLEAGLSAPVLALPRSSNLHVMQTAGVYGALTKLAEIKHQRASRFAIEIEVEEIR
jgi:hypothetical protein